MITFRPSKQSDFLLYLSCFEDVPADEQGRYTIRRAQAEATINAFANEKVAYPLTDESDWTQMLVILNDNVPIGLNRASAQGTVVTVLYQAFLPEWRGKGLFAELQTVLQDYAFNTLEATEAVYAIQKRSIGALAHVTHRGQYEVVEDEVVSDKTGEVLQVGRLAKVSWETANVSSGPVPRDVAGRDPVGETDSGP